MLTDFYLKILSDGNDVGDSAWMESHLQKYSCPLARGSLLVAIGKL